MDEWDQWQARMEIARSENRNAYLDGDPERRVRAKKAYEALIEEFHYMFEIHREKVEHGKRSSQDQGAQAQA